MASACVVVDVVAKGAAAHVGSSKPKGLSEKRGANFRAAARSGRIARRSAARVAAPRTAVVTAAKGGGGDDEKVRRCRLTHQLDPSVLKTLVFLNWLK